MSDRDNQMRLLQAICLVVTVGMSACAGVGLWGFGKDSWKEEVLLHDGSKMIITRSQTYGGRHEIGQPPPIKEHTITFTLPESDKRITWTSEYGDDIGRTNFYLLAVHVLKGTSYIVAEPNLCLSYNKWGRPNPPYVFFEYDGKAWQRIPLDEFPAEFTAVNVALTLGRKDVEAMVSMGLVPAENIKERNGRLQQPERKTILREPVASVGRQCGEMIRTNEGWEGLGFFKSQPSYEACSKYCGRKGVDRQNCPCKNLFKEK
jgi:hypothetical protein